MYDDPSRDMCTQDFFYTELRNTGGIQTRCNIFQLIKNIEMGCPAIISWAAQRS